jgi:hypothetical protein
MALELSHALNHAIHVGALRPSDVLVRNEVGNLAIERDGVYVGFVDVMFGEVTVFDEYATGMDARPDAPSVAVALAALDAATDAYRDALDRERS